MRQRGEIDYTCEVGTLVRVVPGADVPAESRDRSRLLHATVLR